MRTALSFFLRTALSFFSKTALSFFLKTALSVFSKTALSFFSRTALSFFSRTALSFFSKTALSFFSKTASMLLLMSVAAIQALASPAAGESGYVGSAVCKGCHLQVWNEWKQSHHYRSMMLPTEASVLGRFEGEQVQLGGISSRMFKADGRFFIETEIGTDIDKKTATFEVKYTFGHFPLQQYLLATEGGRLQAFNLAWDARPESGGRWINLQADPAVKPGSPFFWTGHFFNWNTQCADCHSTGVEIGYIEKGSFHTTFAEINVACEACHGPGRDHLLAGGKEGSIFNAPNEIIWAFAEGGPIARPVKKAIKKTTTKAAKKDAASASARQAVQEASNRMISMCGGCHSRRSRLKASAGFEQDYHDLHELALLEPGLYHADGQIDDEVFVLGSFLQSKMHGAGVTCSNCHNPHTGKLLLQGNSLCAQCHDMRTYDTQAHHFHPMQSAQKAAPLCADCHLPQKTYMLVDDRADHQFGVPHLDPASDLPSACLNCHDEMPLVDVEKPKATAAARTSKRASKQSNWAAVHADLRRLDPSALSSNMSSTMSSAMSSAMSGALALLSPRTPEDALPPIQAASLIRRLPASAPLSLLRQTASHSSPLVRRATALALEDGLEHRHPERSRALLRQLAKDETASVRLAAAKVLASQFHAPGPEGKMRPEGKMKPEGSMKPEGKMEKDKRFFAELMDEYRQSLNDRSHSPVALTELASLEVNLGRVKPARRALEQALALEPNYLPALLNLADLHRALDDETAAAKLLAQAVAFAPDSGAANFALALSLVRRKRADDALVHFAAAIQQADATPRYFYVYAVALDSAGQTALAINVLRQAKSTWPWQPSLGQLEMLLTQKASRNPDK